MLMLLVPCGQAHTKVGRGYDYGLVSWRLKPVQSDNQEASVGSDLELVACYLGLASIGIETKGPELSHCP